MNSLQYENQKLKTNNSSINIKILESLINYSKKEDNTKLNEMISDLINYKNKFENLDDFGKKQQQLNLKHTLYQYLQKNLLETIYIKDKEKKYEKANDLYLWYKGKIKLFENLRYMKTKSYIGPEEFDGMDYINEKFKDTIEERKKYISQTEREKMEMKFRNLESYNKQSIKSINNYRRKLIKIRRNKSQIISSNIIPEKRICRPYERKNILEEKHGNRNNNLNISFPFLNYSLLKTNKIIIDSKNKIFSEKRSQEENEKKIDEFCLNKAKYKADSMNKFEIQQLISNYVKENEFNSFLLKKYNNNKIRDREKKVDIYNNLMENKYEKIENRLINIKRNKIFINNIHNLNIETNKIIDQEKGKIKFIDIFLKYPSIQINNKLINKCLNCKNIPSDSISKLLFNNKIFKQRLIYNNLLNIKNKGERTQSTINNYSLKSNIFDDESKYITNDKNKYNLSAYNIENIENLNKKHISDEHIKENNVKIYKINNVYKIYKDNYLNLRKSISNFRKSEYQELVNLSKKKSSIDIKDEGNNNENKHNKKEYKDNLDDKILFKNKIKIIKDKNINNLSSAILNPNESNTFSKYYLPRSGSLLLSRYK